MNSLVAYDSEISDSDDDQQSYNNLANQPTKPVTEEFQVKHLEVDCKPFNYFSKF